MCACFFFIVINRFRRRRSFVLFRQFNKELLLYVTHSFSFVTWQYSPMYFPCTHDLLYRLKHFFFFPPFFGLLLWRLRSEGEERNVHRACMLCSGNVSEGEIALTIKWGTHTRERNDWKVSVDASAILCQQVSDARHVAWAALKKTNKKKQHAAYRVYVETLVYADLFVYYL